MRKGILACILVVLFSCSKENNELIVVNSQGEKYSEIEKLQLDEKYNNLLNPQFSTEEEYKEVRKSWFSFHTQIAEIVKENNFKWEVQDSAIMVLNKIYFNKNGEVDYYVFRVLNESVPNEKKELYEKILTDNVSKIEINLKRNKQFSQCGKVKYQNY